MTCMSKQSHPTVGYDYLCRSTYLRSTPKSSHDHGKTKYNETTFFMTVFLVTCSSRRGLGVINCVGVAALGAWYNLVTGVINLIVLTAVRKEICHHRSMTCKHATGNGSISLTILPFLFLCWTPRVAVISILSSIVAPEVVVILTPWQILVLSEWQTMRYVKVPLALIPNLINQSLVLHMTRQFGCHARKLAATS